MIFLDVTLVVMALVVGEALSIAIFEETWYWLLIVVHFSMVLLDKSSLNMSGLI
jgi:hypothetical protein